MDFREALRRRLEMKRRSKMFKTVRKMNGVSRGDALCAAYYLYCAAELDEERKYPSDDSVELFFKLASLLGKTDQVGEFLEKYVLAAEKRNLLEPIRPDGERCFEDSKIRYEYREDRDVERNIRDASVVVDKNLVNLYRCFYVSDAGYRFFAKLAANFLLRKSCTRNFSLLENIPDHIEKILFNNSLTRFISDSVDISEAELKYLTFCYRCEVIPLLSEIIEGAFEHGVSRQEFVIKALDITPKEYKSLFDRNKALCSFGFINDSGEIEDETLHSIEIQSLDPFFDDFVKRADFSNTYELNSFNVGEETSLVLQGAFAGRKSFSFLLYGKPGSGKTEYAKALAKASGLKTLVFKNEEESTRTSVANRLNFFLSIAHPDSLIIVDEADTLLKTIDFTFIGPIPSKNKGIVNKMFENNKNKVIWIVNHTKQIDSSTRRRFNFSCKFEEMPKERFRSIILSKLEGLNVGEELKLQIVNFVEKYNVTGSSIENVVSTIQNLENVDPSKLSSCIEAVFKSNSNLLSEDETKKSKMREKTKSGYDLHALNTSMKPDSIVEMIKNAQDFARSNKFSEKGIRLLFYGLSGTGKTELVRYIAEKLGKNILLKRASDLLDCYVGGTEKNIGRAFEEAERTDSILLLDEADSFFRNREGAVRSWEVTQVNELLTQMEEFKGIFICTTNLRKIMDPAMNRRFHAIIEFRPLECKGIEALLKSYFGKYDFSDSDVARIAAFNSAAPGDFGILSQRMRFMKQSEVGSALIVEELCKIQREKSNGNQKTGRIGYCA